MRKRVIVLGAGFQGVCAAFALQHRGYAVTLIDKAPDCMLRASLRNEGKIHIGFVYANDPSFRTTALMLRSSMSFAPLIEEWLGRRLDWNSIKSEPFTYVIARESLLPSEKILEHYEKLQSLYKDLGETNYLGEAPCTLWEEAHSSACERLVNPDFAVQFIQTVEAAIDLSKFRNLMRSALDASNKVEKLYHHKVESISRGLHAFQVEGTCADGEIWKREADAVVNCLWEGRLKLDHQMGRIPKDKWVYRLKYRLLGDLPPDLAGLSSITIVLGPYGDIVVNPQGKSYISWYPASMRGWSTDVVTPRSWEDPCNGEVGVQSAKMIEQQVLEQFDAIVPGIRHSKVETVDAGIIFSWGSSDIHDPASRLHERHNIGVESSDGYFSVNTGKFTCAPLFAWQLAEMLQ